ncbi:hypothetical protein BC831DRAFT_497484 [Entophlyctis helioformis]|nr:hypothetical protein BC831DRAFT_497484 [Entophlyctis helioformis]
MAEGAATYRSFLAALSKVALKGPAPPKLLNYHTRVLSPFHTAPVSASDPFLAFNRAKTDKYSARLHAAASSPEAAASPFLSDIPVPTVLVRHMLQPVPALAQGSSLGKIIGFRIESKGRRGTRTSRQVVDYGRMDTGMVGALDGVFVDFGRSVYVNKKGATGVKVWVTYGSK